ncbi:pyruvate kinase [Tanacetum coccineum]
MSPGNVARDLSGIKTRSEFTAMAETDGPRPSRERAEVMVIDKSWTLLERHEKAFYTGLTKFVDDCKPANEELYPSCDYVTRLDFMAKFTYFKVKGKLTDSIFNEMLEFFQHVFPTKKGYKLPPSYYAIKKTFKMIGLGYESIHACVNDCFLFWGDNNKDVHFCPVCKTSRWKDSNTPGKKVPKKVLRYFPIIPRLQRLYKSSHTAKEMTWHATGKCTEPGKMQHPVDGRAWKNFDTKYPNFAKEPRNVRLGLAADEISFMLTLLIPGPKSSGKDIDVYSRPLIDDLKVLWALKGVETIDQYLPDEVAKPIIELCSFFKQICSVTLMEDDMLKAQSKVVDILCNLELIYPPAFFDIMIYLVIHLPLEALEGGSIRPWWMFPFERFMKKLKGYVQNKAKPEVIRFDAQELKKVTWYVLHNSPEIDTYRSQFKSKFPNKDMKEVFPDWFGRSCVVPSKAFKDDQYILATQVKQCFYLEDMARRQPHWKVVEHVNHKKFSDGGVIVVEEDPDVIHFNNSSDLPLSTSFSDLDNETLHIDGQSTEVDALPNIIDLNEDDDIIDDEDAIPHDLADSDDEDLVNVDDDDGVDVMSADVARGHGDDGSGKGTRKPNLGGRKAGRLHTRQETRNLGLKKITNGKGPVPIRFEWDDKKTLMPLGDHASHWSNYLRKLIREMPLYYPSWQKVLAERKAAILTHIRMESSATREYPSLINTFFVTHTVNGVFTRDEDRPIYEEMLRLQALGSNTPSGVPYTDEEINALDRKGKQRGHLPGVGRVLPGRATDYESTPEFGSGSGGCGDDEMADDEDGDEDEEDEEDGDS